MSSPDPLHRYPKTMAVYFLKACRRILECYAGDASRIWSGSPSSATIVSRFLQFDGVGLKIATMAANLLVREFKVPVKDKYSIDVSVDVHVRRVFVRLGLIPKEASNEQLIYLARELNPTYPGVVDPSAWEIGRNWCRPKKPLCDSCYMRTICTTAQTEVKGTAQ